MALLEATVEVLGRKAEGATKAEAVDRMLERSRNFILVVFVVVVAAVSIDDDKRKLKEVM